MITPPAIRVLEHELLRYRRAFRGTLVSSFLNPVLYLAAMGGIPATLYEAAQIDGANRWTEFWRITLPLLKPTTLYLAIMGTIGSFQVFTSIYMMTRGGPNYATTTVVYRIYETAFEFLKLGRASAMALILALIIVGVSIVQFRVLGTEVEY